MPFKAADVTTHRVASTACLSRSCRCAASSAATNPASASVHGLVGAGADVFCNAEAFAQAAALVRFALPRAAPCSSWREAAKLRPRPRVMRWLPSVSHPSRQALPSVSSPHSPGAGKALANMHTHLQTRFGMHASLLFYTRDIASAPRAKTPTPRPGRGVGDRALLALHHCVRCTRRIVLMRFTARQASAYRSCTRFTYSI